MGSGGHASSRERQCQECMLQRKAGGRQWRPPAKEPAQLAKAIVLTCVHVMGGSLLPTTDGFSVSVTFLLAASKAGRGKRGGQVDRCADDQQRGHKRLGARHSVDIRRTGGNSRASR